MSADILCAVRVCDDETMYTCQLNEAQVADLASGYVPRDVKATMIDFLTWREQQERAARRPLPPRRKRR